MDFSEREVVYHTNNPNFSVITPGLVPSIAPPPQTIQPPIEDVLKQKEAEQRNRRGQLDPLPRFNGGSTGTLEALKYDLDMVLNNELKRTLLQAANPFLEFVDLLLAAGSSQYTRREFIYDVDFFDNDDNIFRPGLADQTTPYDIKLRGRKDTTRNLEDRLKLDPEEFEKLKSIQDDPDEFLSKSDRDQLLKNLADANTLTASIARFASSTAGKFTRKAFRNVILPVLGTFGSWLGAIASLTSSWTGIVLKAALDLFRVKHLFEGVYERVTSLMSYGLTEKIAPAIKWVFDRILGPARTEMTKVVEEVNKKTVASFIQSKYGGKPALAMRIGASVNSYMNQTFNKSNTEYHSLIEDYVDRYLMAAYNEFVSKFTDERVPVEACKPPNIVQFQQQLFSVLIKDAYKEDMPPQSSFMQQQLFTPIGLDLSYTFNPSDTGDMDKAMDQLYKGMETNMKNFENHRAKKQYTNLLPVATIVNRIAELIERKDKETNIFNFWKLDPIREFLETMKEQVASNIGKIQTALIDKINEHFPYKAEYSRPESWNRTRQMTIIDPNDKEQKREIPNPDYISPEIRVTKYKYNYLLGQLFPERKYKLTQERDAWQNLYDKAVGSIKNQQVTMSDAELMRFFESRLQELITEKFNYLPDPDGEPDEEEQKKAKLKVVQDAILRVEALLTNVNNALMNKPPTLEFGKMLEFYQKSLQAANDALTTTMEDENTLQLELNRALEMKVRLIKQVTDKTAEIAASIAAYTEEWSPKFRAHWNNRNRTDIDVKTAINNDIITIKKEIEKFKQKQLKKHDKNFEQKYTEEYHRLRPGSSQDNVDTYVRKRIATDEVYVKYRTLWDNFFDKLLGIILLRPLVNGLENKFGIPTTFFTAKDAKDLNEDPTNVFYDASNPDAEPKITMEIDDTSIQVRLAQLEGYIGVGHLLKYMEHEVLYDYVDTDDLTDPAYDRVNDDIEKVLESLSTKFDLPSDLKRFRAIEEQRKKAEVQGEKEWKRLKNMGKYFIYDVNADDRYKTFMNLNQRILPLELNFHAVLFKERIKGCIQMAADEINLCARQGQVPFEVEQLIVSPYINANFAKFVIFIYEGRSRTNPATTIRGLTPYASNNLQIQARPPHRTRFHMAEDGQFMEGVIHFFRDVQFNPNNNLLEYRANSAQQMAPTWQTARLYGTMAPPMVNFNVQAPVLRPYLITGDNNSKRQRIDFKY